MRMRSTGAASASRMLCPVSAMNASSRVRPPVCFSQRRGGALRDDPAVVDDRDPVGDALRLLHVVRREKHRHVLVAAQPADEFPDLVAGLRVEPAGRLVEEQDARPVLQCAGDFEPALHAAREALDVVVAPLPQADEAQQRLDALAALCPRHA